MGNKEIKKNVASAVKVVGGVVLLTAGTVLAQKGMKELGKKLIR